MDSFAGRVPGQTHRLSPCCADRDQLPCDRQGPEFDSVRSRARQTAGGRRSAASSGGVSRSRGNGPAAHVPCPGAEPVPAHRSCRGSTRTAGRFGLPLPFTLPPPSGVRLHRGEFAPHARSFSSPWPTAHLTAAAGNHAGCSFAAVSRPASDRDT